MGQKVHPRVFRLGITQTWLSRWYKGQGYAEQLHQDIKLRQYVKTRLSSAGVSSVEVERAANRVKVSVRTARPGLVIGRKGKEIDDLRAELRRVAGRDVLINIVEVRKPDIDAQLVAETICTQLERRVNFRRVVKDVVGKAMRLGAEGIKVNISGRVGGAEIARSEWAREGKVSLHTLRSNIDYGFAEALTTYGIIGVKVWISKGLVVEPEDTTELSIGVM